MIFKNVSQVKNHKYFQSVLNSKFVQYLLFKFPKHNFQKENFKYLFSYYRTRVLKQDSNFADVSYNVLRSAMLFSHSFIIAEC